MVAAVALKRTVRTEVTVRNAMWSVDGGVSVVGTVALTRILSTMPKPVQCTANAQAEVIAVRCDTLGPAERQIVGLTFEHAFGRSEKLRKYWTEFSTVTVRAHKGMDSVEVSFDGLMGFFRDYRITGLATSVQRNT